MIGDKLCTDIQFGKNAGIKKALVQTGCNSAKDIENEIENPTGVVPDFLLVNLAINLS